jgi:hypothetical protein
MSLISRLRDRLRRRAASASNNTAEARKRQLDHKVVVWEVAERLFAALVIVGVFVEYGDKFLEFFHCPNVHTLGMIAGGALIAFGVLGEIWASSRGFKAERELDRENEKTIAELNREADREKAKLAELMLLSEWRTVGDLSAFEDAMRRFAGDQQYILQFAESEDKEPRQLMSQLHRALPNAGWIPIGETPRRGIARISVETSGSCATHSTTPFFF